MSTERKKYRKLSWRVCKLEERWKKWQLPLKPTSINWQRPRWWTLCHGLALHFPLFKSVHRSNVNWWFCSWQVAVVYSALNHLSRDLAKGLGEKIHKTYGFRLWINICIVTSFLEYLKVIGQLISQLAYKINWSGTVEGLTYQDRITDTLDNESVVQTLKRKEISWLSYLLKSKRSKNVWCFRWKYTFDLRLRWKPVFWEDDSDASVLLDGHWFARTFKVPSTPWKSSNSHRLSQQFSFSCLNSEE